MIMPFGFTCVFTIRTVSGTDADNNDVYSSVNTSVPGCGFAPGGSTEILGNQEIVETQPTLYAPTGTDVSAVDAIAVPGYGTFEVDGTPQAWPAHPRTGWQPSNSVVIKLRAVTG